MTTQQGQAPPYQQDMEEVLTELTTDGQRGLRGKEARTRLERDGRNELTAEKPVPAWRKFLAQFQDPLVILLLLATAISAGLWLYERESAYPTKPLLSSQSCSSTQLWATFRNHERSMR